MRRPTVGVLHPGQMGTAVAAAAKPLAAQVIWAEEDRSRATTKRAEWADLVAVPTVSDLVRRSDVVLSLCPPHAALDVARAVHEAGGVDLYVEANAVAPATVEAVAALLGAEHVVDGAVTGPPPWQADEAVLHLSGPRSAEVVALFAGSPLATSVVGERLGQACALKACFALHTKAVPTAYAVLAAAAEHHGVGDALRAELARAGLDLDAAVARVARSLPKAWRFAGEMEEAAATFTAAGLPGGVSSSAAEVYRRLADALERDATADPAAVLAALLDEGR
ncbi:hypothetical protein GCM10027446_22750 [Angustibacter peucedani]